MAESGTLFKRHAAGQVAAALKDTPVVMINGPRQCGKTTLARGFAGKGRAYLTMDDDTVLEAARSDPAGLVRGLDCAIIDEVQRAPELLRAIKRAVDDDRRPGRFLLTGSANVLTLPHVSESLAGRMEVISLLPLSMTEVRGAKPAFLKSAFEGRVATAPETVVGDDLVDAVATGGYPGMLQRRDRKRRQAWARDYVKAIVRRDVRDIADVERLDRLPRLLQVLAHYSGRLVNFAQAGGRIALDDKTTRKYVTILEQLFLVRRVEPWFRNHLKRMIKTSRLHFLDSGLLAAVIGATPERIAGDRALLGPLLETFVFSEILKQAGWLDKACMLYHYRDKDQDEVDIVTQNNSGELVGIEVKASATVSASDFRGLKKLAGACGKDFKLGVVLYDGDATVPFGDRLFAAPVSCLWG